MQAQSDVFDGERQRAKKVDIMCSLGACRDRIDELIQEIKSEKNGDS